MFIVSGTTVGAWLWRKRKTSNEYLRSPTLTVSNEPEH